MQLRQEGWQRASKLAEEMQLTELVPGGSLKAPEYGRHFSEAASRKFFQKYAEYEEAVKLSNKGRTVQARSTNCDRISA